MYIYNNININRACRGDDGDGKLLWLRAHCSPKDDGSAGWLNVRGLEAFADHADTDDPRFGHRLV